MPTNPSSHDPARRPAQAVTGVARSAEDDRVHRMKQYLWAMGVRTLAFPAAVWAFLSGYTTLGWVLAAFAALIPSFAVMLANAVDRRRTVGDAPQSPVRGLGAGASAEPGAAPPEAAPRTPDVVPGTVVPPPASPRHDQPEEGSGDGRVAS